MSIEMTIREFLSDNFFVEADEFALPADASLTQGGTIDSMGVLELIMFIEQHFGIRIPDADTTPENLDTISRIVSYVESRQPAPAGA